MYSPSTYEFFRNAVGANSTALPRLFAEVLLDFSPGARGFVIGKTVHGLHSLLEPLKSFLTTSFENPLIPFVVALGVEQNAGALLSVSASPSDLLNIALQRQWKSHVDHQTNIGLVNTKAKGIRSHHN